MRNCCNSLKRYRAVWCEFATCNYIILNINYTDSNHKLYDRSFEIQASANWNKDLLIDTYKCKGDLNK